MTPYGPPVKYNKGEDRSTGSVAKLESSTMIRVLRFLLLHLSATAWALSPTHITCQLKKSDNLPPLTGCAPGTIFVSQDDPRAGFTSVQAAILSL